MVKLRGSEPQGIEMRFIGIIVITKGTHALAKSTHAFETLAE